MTTKQKTRMDRLWEKVSEPFLITVIAKDQFEDQEKDADPRWEHIWHFAKPHNVYVEISATTTGSSSMLGPEVICAAPAVRQRVIDLLRELAQQIAEEGRKADKMGHEAYRKQPDTV